MMNLKKTYSRRSRQQLRQTEWQYYPYSLVPIESDVVPSLSELNEQLALLPVELMRKYLESLILRELDEFSSVCMSQARELDDAYSSQVHTFENTLSDKCEEIIQEFESKL